MPTPSTRRCPPKGLLWITVLLTAASCASMGQGHRGQFTAPTPTTDEDDTAGVTDSPPGDDSTGEASTDTGDGNGPSGGSLDRAAQPWSGPAAALNLDVATEEPDKASDDPEAPSLNRGFALWHDGHYGASIDALHEALSSQDVNDPGRALAYWHIYLAHQALGHAKQGQQALADFVAVAQDMVTAEKNDPTLQSPDAQGFAQAFDLSGRLARARATLNLAWAAQTHRVGRSLGHPVLVYNDIEMKHFLDLAPPCAHHSDHKVVAVERRRDADGRPTAQAIVRCHKAGCERHFYFAFIGNEDHPEMGRSGPQ